MRVEEQLPSATRLLALAGLRRVRGVALGQQFRRQVACAW